MREKNNGRQPKGKQPHKSQYFINPKKLALRLLVICSVILLTVITVEFIEDARSVSTLGINNPVPTKKGSAPVKTVQNVQPGDSKVVVDAGHGGFDPGTYGTKTNTAEMEINLAIALRLQHALEENGFHVIMTREDKNAIAETKDADMQRRSEIIAADGVDLVVSIHQNWYDDPSAKGPQAFYYPGSAEGSALAALIQGSLNSDLSIKEPRQSLPEDYFVLRSGNAPAVIVECGFLSNPQDEKSLLDKDYQQAVAESITEGVLQYFQNK